MSFLNIASEIFPRVPHWIGNSEIHVSISKQAILSIDPEIPIILRYMKASQLGEKIHQQFVYLFDGVEWLVDEETFAKMLMVLVRCGLEGKSFETPDMIQNPVTGNYFHRIALFPQYDIVLGFRCWTVMYDDVIRFGWRLRVSKLEGDEEHKKVRVEASRRRQVILESIDELYDMIAEVPEPPVVQGEVELLYSYHVEESSDGE